jgi:broad specificity phosphatase PhoE
LSAAKSSFEFTFMIPKDAARRRIFLMRHGSVSYFDVSGKPLPPDTAPLNALGIAQAQAAGRLFAERKIVFDRVIVSGLARTVKTAELVLAATGQSIAAETRPNLVELRGGKLSAIPDDQMQSAFQDAFDGHVPEHTRFLGGESIGELLDRVLPEVDALRADPHWDIVLLVLHGGVNRAILSYLLNGRRSMMGALAQSPACINTIDIGTAKSDVVLRGLNISPTDFLQTETRRTTMEALYEQYAKYRSRFGDGINV